MILPKYVKEKKTKIFVQNLMAAFDLIGCISLALPKQKNRQRKKKKEKTKMELNLLIIFL